MTKNVEADIKQIIMDEVEKLNRPDLVRRPLVAFSSAGDERYAELKQIVGEWHLTPTEMLPGAQSVISYFIPLTERVVLDPKSVPDGSLLWGEAYVVINAYFNHINDAIAQYLTAHGFSAKTIRPTHTYDPGDLKSMWSHRSAAAIAGLGAFGLNRMLITERGSGGRFCTVITSAPLKTEQARAQNKCLYFIDGSCGLCMKICPVDALAPDGFDKFTCQKELNKNGEKQKGKTEYMADTCGKCISICPMAYIGES